MPYVLTVSPDFTPKHIAGWYIFNTWLQKQTGLPIHLELYDNFKQQRQAIADDKIDLIYANPYDASILVRRKGFVALTAPMDKADETIIACRNGSAINNIEDLTTETRIVTTDDPDVHLMGMMMLEPADLDASNTHIQAASSYVLVAKQLLQDKADIGFFLKDAFHDLSNLIKSDLKVLISSEIQIIRHVLLVSPTLQAHYDDLKAPLINMHNDAKGESVLKSMGFSGWEAQTQEDTEFMIDLMNTL